MVKSALISLLKTFSKEEWKRFGLFLKSPYFNQSESMLRFYRFLRRFCPGLDSPKLNRQKAFAAAYGKKESYKKSKVNDLMYKMKGLAEAFLAHEGIGVQPGQSEYQLAIQLARREGAHPFFEKAAKKAVEATEKQPESIGRHWAMLWLHHLMYHHPERKAVHEAPPYDLYKAMSELDQLYLYAKFRYSTELLSRQKYLEEKPEIRLLGACQEAMDRGFDGHGLLELHYWIVKLYSGSQEEEAYWKAKQLLLDKLKQIGPVEKMSAYLILLNYVIRRSNKGEESWAREMLKWHKLGLDEGILLDKGWILKSTFTNIAINAAALKEFRFTKEFIEEYQAYLKPEDREEAVVLAHAYLDFHRENYTEANKILQSAPYYSLVFKVRSYSIQIRCQYEFYLKDGTYKETLLDTCNKFRYYLKNDHNWAAEKKRGYLNFIAVLKKLVRYREKKKKNLRYQPKKKPEEMVEEKSPLYLKEWLQEKAAMLESL